MNNLLFGALVHGRRSGPDACSTVEARSVEGSPRIVMLAAVEGDLATPALESVKGAFAKIAEAEATVAAKLTAAAPPAPYASGVAVVLLVGARAFVAAKGAARCYLERGGKLEAIEPGAYDLAAGEAIVAASRAALGAGAAFFEGAAARPLDDTFRNDALDAALEAALGRGASGFVAVSAARVGS